jgi:hypothetical protein
MAMNGIALIRGSAWILALQVLLALPGRAEVAAADASAPFEMKFTKGDTREGAQVRIRVVGDSLHYSRTDYAPGRDAELSFRSTPLDARRKLAMKRILGDLPRFQVFGSCFGKGMRYYLIDVPGGKFYRSVPESSGRCFTDEPGIWSLLEDLDTFLAPPEDDEDPDYSAGLDVPRS